jgi:hypothetical protein
MRVLPAATAGMTAVARRVRDVTMAQPVMTMAAGTTELAQVAADLATGELMAAGHRAASATLVQGIAPTQAGARPRLAVIARVGLPMSAVPATVPTPTGPVGPGRRAAGRAEIARSAAVGKAATARSGANARAATARSAASGAAAIGRSTVTRAVLIGHSVATGKVATARSAVLIGRSVAAGRAVIARSAVLIGHSGVARRAATGHSGAAGRVTGRGGTLIARSVVTGVPMIGHSGTLTGRSVVNGRAVGGRAATGQSARVTVISAAAVGRSVAAGIGTGLGQRETAMTGRRGGPTTVADRTARIDRARPTVTVARLELKHRAPVMNTFIWTCPTASAPTS